MLNPKGIFFQTSSSLAIYLIMLTIPSFLNYLSFLKMLHFPGFLPTFLVIPLPLLKYSSSPGIMSFLAQSIHSPWVLSISQKLQLPPICWNLLYTSCPEPSPRLQISTANYLLYISTSLYGTGNSSQYFPNYIVTDNNFLGKKSIFTYFLHFSA